MGFLTGVRLSSVRFFWDDTEVVTIEDQEGICCGKFLPPWRKTLSTAHSILERIDGIGMKKARVGAVAAPVGSESLHTTSITMLWGGLGHISRGVVQILVAIGSAALNCGRE